MASALLPLPAANRGRPPTAGLRDKILAAAEHIFARHEYHEVLMDQVARDCAVAKGTVYRYFPSKRALYLAVMFEGIERLRDELQVALDSPGAPVQKIECIVHCILTRFWDRRLFFALIHRIEHRPDDPDSREWLRRRREISRLIQRALEQAITAGQVRKVEPYIATEMLLGLLRAVNRYRREDDTLERMATAVVDVFLRGVGTAAGQLQISGVRGPAAWRCAARRSTARRRATKVG